VIETKRKKKRDDKDDDENEVVYIRRTILSKTGSSHEWHVL
jgi:hypothetical protein